MSDGGPARRVTLDISIEKSIGEELVRIGSTITHTLKQHVSDRIDDIERYRRTGKSVGLSPAEKLALDEGNDLEVSWASTEKDSAKLHKNALLQAYVGQHLSKPGYQSRMTGKWGSRL